MKLLIFAGTTEGRELAQFLSARGAAAEVFVATAYGRTVLPEMPHIRVRTGRLSCEEMAERMDADTLVIDATHPYAVEVTANIKTAAAQAGAEYLRLLRPRVEAECPVITVPDAAAAAEYLNGVTGAALLTTGSKELEAFTKVERFAERLWPRVLASEEVLHKCRELGFAPAHILAMQGPFSQALNEALLRHAKAKYLVTKDTGTAGGFAEKIRAAEAVGASVILIDRPTEESGLSPVQMQELLTRRLGLQEDCTAGRFPLFISLADRKCVVFGAGHVGRRRVQKLRDFGAQVKCIAPDGDADEKRPYRKEDLGGVFLAVAATGRREVNAQIAADCAAAGIWCSVADSAEESSFYFPAICQGGGLIAGVVSGGQQHSAVARAAAQIREVLQKEDGE